MISTTFSGALAIQGGAANGSVAVHVAANETTAFIGPGATVTAGGNVLVLATDRVFMGLGAGGISGGIAAAALSSATVVTVNSTEARIDDGVTVDAFGNAAAQEIPDGEGGTKSIRGVAVVADSSEEIFSFTAGGTAGAVAASGSFTTTSLNETTRAIIGENARINTNTPDANTQQSVQVIAADQTRLIGGAGSVGAGAVGIGGSIEIGVIDKTTEALIGKFAEVRAANDVIVKAIAGEELVSVSASASGGAVAGAAGASSSTLLNTTRAIIDENAMVYADDTVHVDALDVSDFTLVAGQGGGAGVGAGATAALTTVEKTTEALIAANAVVIGLGNGDGVAGLPMTDGPFIGISANFNLQLQIM